MRTAIVAVFGVGLNVASAQIHEDVKITVDVARSFGSAVDVQDGMLAIGDSGYSEQVATGGTAYLVDASTGEVIRQYLPDDPSPQKFFGSRVVIHEDVVVVGTLLDDEFGLLSGAVYVFDKATGEQKHKLTTGQGGGGFGAALEVHDGIVVASAVFEQDEMGAVYLFDLATGQQIDRITPDDNSPDQLFGFSLRAANNQVFISAPWDDEAAEDAGAVYVYDIASGTMVDKYWGNGEAFSQFGWSMDVSDGVLVASAVGAAYLVDLATKDVIKKLEPNAAYGRPELQDFAREVAMAHGLVAIGAPDAYGAQNAIRSGLVYLFDATDGSSIAELLPLSPGHISAFGRRIAMDDEFIAVGAPAVGNGNDDGAAYVFGVITDCPSDVNGDFFVDILDFVAFQQLWMQQDMAADCDENGAFDASDFVCFQQQFMAGCG